MSKPGAGADLVDHAGSRAPRGWVETWWQAVRPFSFSASATPVIVGSAVAYDAGEFHPLLFVITLLAAMSIHAATNLVNDYYDHVRGVDARQPIGPGGAIQRGELSPASVWKGAVALFAFSAALGVWLFAVRGWPIIAIGALSVLAGYAYTGGPVPLGYLGLGDLVVFIFMGLIAVAGTYFVHTGAFSATAVWAAVPVAALVDGILVANNLRDLDNDRAQGKRTLATFIGASGTRLHYLGLLVLTYLGVMAGVMLRALPVTTLLAVATVPSAVAVWRVVRAESAPLPLTLGGVRATAQLHLRVGLLIAAGLVLAQFL